MTRSLRPASKKRKSGQKARMIRDYLNVAGPESDAFWVEGSRAKKRYASIIEARVAYREKNGIKTKDEIRILYLKKRHEIAKLKRQFPEVDFDRPDRDKRFAKRCKWSPKG